MKKIILSLSALTLGATPAVSMLNITQKQVITEVTKEIQAKIDETSVLFKAPIITNAQKQNSSITTNWLNEQKVADLSNIDSNLTYADFNNQTYDMTSANKTLKQIYKQSDYKYANEDAKAELIFGAADTGLSLLENSVDDNGLKPQGINEFLNWISYVSFISGDKLKADKFDDSILKLSKQLSFLKAFKTFPAPSYTKLISEGVITNKGLKYYSLSNLNSFVSINFGLTSETNAWNFKINESNIENTFLDSSSKMYQEIFSKDGDGNSKHSFQFNQQSIEYLFNFIYSLSWYIQAFDPYSPSIESITDQNHIFSNSKTNIEVMNEVYNKPISKNDITKKGLSGILQLVYDVINSKEDKNGYKASRTLKILFQVDDDINDKNTNLDFDTKVLKANKGNAVAPSFRVGDWQNNSKKSNGLFNAFFASVFKGFLDNQVSGFLGWFLGILSLSNENLGGIAAGLISSIFSGIDMDNFFQKLSSQLSATLKNMYGWRLVFLPIGGQIKEPLEKILKGLGFGTDDSPNKPHKPDITDDFIDYLDKIIKKFSNIKISNESEETWSIFNNLFNQIVNEKGRLQSLLKVLGVSLPIDISDKSLKEIFSTKVFGIFSIGDLLIKALNFIDVATPEIFKVLGLFSNLLGSDICKEYEFYYKGNDKPLEIRQVLGYEPLEDGTSDLAVIWSMMKFVKDEEGKNKVVGVRLKDDENSDIIYGHKAWKMLLGLNYDEMSFYDNSLLYWLNETLASGLTAKVIQLPIKVARSYVDNTLSDIQFNRNKKMTYWSNKELFTNEFISYTTDSKQEVLKYNIRYKIKKETYLNYEVAVYKENTATKYKILSFNKK
ncbi:hypothetical protein CK556_00860 [Mesoplasma chauliocola]|uniref:MOLPALP family lipoprotein n=1 Tax=Mesoplasma chauliocola TaxID=216427 RepID=A0A249SMT6_9MOLU|nr:hypothetical protein [Mesoplasma chauliocola]ASZ08917.1 hypothetical protein CK556_00860 [Mesoplasma chauliocola]